MKRLRRKFRVERADGGSAPGRKHEHCEYFVLDLSHDRFAREALLAYSKACREEHPELSAEVLALAVAMRF